MTNERGFTIIEVLVAVMVLTVGVVAMVTAASAYQQSLPSDCTASVVSSRAQKELHSPGPIGTKSCAISSLTKRIKVGISLYWARPG